MYTPFNMFTGAVVDEETGKAMEYRNLINSEKYRAVWSKAMVKELDQLAQGKCRQKGMDTIKFIKKHEVPGGRKATYARIVVDYRPQKTDPNRVHLTVGRIG
eukprot:15346074-Ditylum_brightwellii.AAC.1